MGELSIEKKYEDFIEELVGQITEVLPEDINELQKNYLVTNIKKSATLLASSMKETDEFSALNFDEQCFYIQVMAEWSFHKEIDLFRSGIPAKYWKVVMQKIWYTMWEVMFACIKNEAPQAVVLTLVERFVNRTYTDAVEELKDCNVIDEKVEEQAKEQSNIYKMAEEIRLTNKLIETFKTIIKNLLIGIIAGCTVTVLILKLKIWGVILIMSWLVAYNLIPAFNKRH